MLTIRLQRVGKRNNPAFRVVLMDARRSAKSGGFLEILGSYNPQHDSSLTLKKDRISHWISKGVQASDTVHNLLVREKVITAPKRNVVALSKTKKQESAEMPADAKIEKQQPEESAPTEAPTEKKEV